MCFYAIYCLTQSKIHTMTQSINHWYQQPLVSTMHTIFKCKAIENVMSCLHIFINMCWASLAWSLTNNIVVLIGAEQTKPNYSNP